MEFIFDWDANEEKIKELNYVINEHRTQKGGLMAVLHEAQKLFGYLPIEVQRLVSEGLNIPLAEIYGVVTFYSQFTLVPKGEYEISVCLGTACYVKGAQDIIEEVKKQIGVEVGQTSTDQKFSLVETRCIGACGLAPVMTINDEVYGKLEAKDITDILAEYKKD